MDLDIINYIKALGLDMINNAESGHPGILLGAAPTMYTLFKDHLRISPNDPTWFNRDRFVLSAGHGSALLYATLHLVGYNITSNDLKQFRQIGSITPGHPEHGLTPGVDVTTGPLGQGLANAVGMAIAEKSHNEKYTFKKGYGTKHLVDFRVYVMCGDGDLMEGISYEAASLAGTLKLNNLIVLYDSNDISLDARTEVTFTENILKRFESMNWDTIFVEDGDNVGEISKAIKKAKTNLKPTLIQIKTIIGKDSKLENTNDAHGTALADYDVKTIKEKLNIYTPPFEVPDQVYTSFRTHIYNNSSKKYTQWANNFNDYGTDDLKKREAINLISNKIEIEQSIFDVYFQRNLIEATRTTNGELMSRFSIHVPNLIGGAADLSSSTKTYLKDGGILGPNNYTNKNIFYGVREHAMGAISNGLALTGFRPFASTFLTFSDYMKPSIRLSCLMNLPVTYIFSHDSVNIGGDGPTHQPIEQLAGLRTIPNNIVLRPADPNEVVGCWNHILNSKRTNCLILSRKEYPIIPTSDSKKTLFGAYIILKEYGNLDGIIVASGTDVHNSILTAINLKDKYNLSYRVVSLPSMELFEMQKQEYKDQLLPKNITTFMIESGTTYGLSKYATNSEYVIGLNKFGASGGTHDVEKYMEIDFNTIFKKIKSKLNLN